MRYVRVLAYNRHLILHRQIENVCEYDTAIQSQYVMVAVHSTKHLLLIEGIRLFHVDPTQVSKVKDAFETAFTCLYCGSS